jgi:hypothetical protein
MMAIIFNKAHQSNEETQMRDTFDALSDKGVIQVGKWRCAPKARNTCGGGFHPDERGWETERWP